MRHFLASAVLLAGCAAAPPAVFNVKPKLLDVHALPECFVACDQCQNGQIAQITTDPDSAVVAAIVEHNARKQCAGGLALCETRRAACAQALQRGIAGGVVK